MEAINLQFAAYSLEPASVILALDPSSTAVGYALLRGLMPDDYIEAGVMRASEARMPADYGSRPWQEWMNRGELVAYRRMLSLERELYALLNGIDWKLELTAVVEVPSGLAGTGAKHGASGGLTTYGAAAGSVWRALQDVLTPDAVYPVTERDWTTGGPSKSARQILVKTMYPQYEVAKDKGCDCSDAVWLARWALEHLL